jgi:hypothetical protein
MLRCDDRAEGMAGGRNRRGQSVGGEVDIVREAPGLGSQVDRSLRPAPSVDVKQPELVTEESSQGEDACGQPQAAVEDDHGKPSPTSWTNSETRRLDFHA